MNTNLFLKVYSPLLRNVHGKLNASWKISSLAVNGQSFLVIDGYLLNTFSFFFVFTFFLSFLFNRSFIFSLFLCNLIESTVTGPLLWNSYYLPVDSFGKKERRKVDRVFANHYLSQPPVSRNFQHSLSLLSSLGINRQAQESITYISCFLVPQPEFLFNNVMKDSRSCGCPGL